jgi:hypothetical protein
MRINGHHASEPHVSELDDEIIEAEGALGLARTYRFADLAANSQLDIAEIFLPMMVGSGQLRTNNPEYDPKFGIN